MVLIQMVILRVLGSPIEDIAGAGNTRFSPDGSTSRGSSVQIIADRGVLRERVQPGANFVVILRKKQSMP